MYTQQKSMPAGKALVCPECNSTRFIYGSGKVTCTNCGWSHASKANSKYGAKKTEFNGKMYDSKYEASVAEELDLRLKGNDILEVIPQFKVRMVAYRADGFPAMTVEHKVDFRIQLKDGSYELVEAKGIETDDYKWRRKFLENIWLPAHPDYTYRVVKQNSNSWKG